MISGDIPAGAIAEVRQRLAELIGDGYELPSKDELWRVGSRQERIEALRNGHLEIVRRMLDGESVAEAEKFGRALLELADDQGPDLAEEARQQAFDVTRLDRQDPGAEVIEVNFNQANKEE